MTKQTKTAAQLSAAFKTATESLTQGVQAYLNSKASIESAIVAMRKTKVIFGKSRATCAMLSFVYDSLGTLKTAKGDALAERTKDNYLNAIKRAINQGAELNLNIYRKAKPEGQSQVPAKKAKVETLPSSGMDEDDTPATDDTKPATVKPNGYKTNEDVMSALVSAIKTVKTQCTAKQWEMVQTLHPKIASLIG
jgi:hypothetical protein